MSQLLNYAKARRKAGGAYNTDDAEILRYDALRVVKGILEEEPPVEEIFEEFICFLLILPPADRIYVQRALRPLAEKYQRTSYLSTLSRVLQETDAWVDLNILTDKERRSLPDMGLEIHPKFKLP